VNWQHLSTFLWLRWRIRVNQLKKGGIANAVVMAIVAAFLALFAVGLFVTAFLVGVLALPYASPPVLMYIWDGLIAVFLFSWCIGLIAELQRSEVLSLEKFLHLPVSPSGAFVINYLSSLASLTLLLFLPAMFALCVALVFAKGPALLLLLPLLAAFLLMVTALTYQFQSWLASLMVNKRRRRTVIVVVTAGFILLCQLPNLINITMAPWRKMQTNEAANLFAQEKAEHMQADARTGTAADHMRWNDEIRQKYTALQKEAQAQREESNRLAVQRVEQTFTLVNYVIPVGWLPLAAMDLAQGDFLVALLGIAGMSLIGTASLWRSYRTVVRMYTGQFSSGTATTPVAAPPPVKNGKQVPATAGLIDKDLPWVSKQAAVIALAGFRSLTRAPEAKMLLLTPIILILVFGSMVFTQSHELPEMARPLLPFGAFSVTLLSMVGLVGNQFGFDRGGFRVFVLCPARRRDVLLGKNLAIAPFAVGLGLVMSVLVEVVYPMRFDHFLAVALQMVSMFVLYCLLANCLAILAPMPIAAGSLKPANPKVIPILLQIAFLLLFPLALAPTLLPLGIEFLLDQLEWAPGVPADLLLSLLSCVGAIYFYRFVLDLQGQWLQAREQKILEVVTLKAE
jgi:hypothetical protein